MNLAAQEPMEHIGGTAPMANHDYDLVQELDKRAKNVWRCDQYIANAEDKPELRQFWREMKQQDLETIERLRALIKKECREECF